MCFGPSFHIVMLHIKVYINIHTQIWLCIQNIYMMWATGLRSEDKHTLRPALQERGLQRKGRDRRLQGLSERQQLGGEE